jgi:hypothetical protein
MKTYARVADGQVVEVFSTDGDIARMFHPDLVWADISKTEPMPKLGWHAARLQDGNWQFSEPIAPPPTVAEILGIRDMLLAEADRLMSPLMDEFVLGELTVEDEERLRAFSEYRKALRALDRKPGFPAAVEWPSKPA